jgi:hypothetical protein
LLNEGERTVTAVRSGPSWLKSIQSQCTRLGAGLSAVRCFELGHDVGDVHAGSLLADKQVPGGEFGLGIRMSPVAASASARR